MADFPLSFLAQHGNADDFNAAGGRACAGADEHQNQQQNVGSRRPFAEVRGGKASGGHKAGGLEKRIPHGSEEIAVQRCHQHADDQAETDENSQIPVQLFIAEEALHVPDKQAEEQGKVNAEEYHEHRKDDLDAGAVEGGCTGSIVAEAACAGRAHGVNGRIIGIHAGNNQCHKLNHRQHKVDGVQNLC